MPPFANFTTKAKEVIKRAHELALERGVSNVNSFHLLTALVLLDDSPVVTMMELSAMPYCHSCVLLLVAS